MRGRRSPGRRRAAFAFAAVLLARSAVGAGDVDHLVFRDGSVAEGEVIEVRYGVYTVVDVESGESRLVARPDLRFVIYGDGARARRFLGVADLVPHCPDLRPGELRLLPAAAHRTHAVEAIRGAERSIYLTAYRLADGERQAVDDVWSALRERARAGVETCVILPAAGGGQVGGPAHALAADGVDLRVIEGGAVMHQKLLIVDRRRVFLGSSDLTPRGRQDPLAWNLAGELPSLVEGAVADFLAARERSRPFETPPR